MPLIPRRDLFGAPEIADPKVSFDGRLLAYLAPCDGVLNLHVAPVKAPLEGHALTSERSRGIGQYEWLPGGNRLLVLKDHGGDEQWRIHVLEVGTGKMRDVTPFPDVNAYILRTSPRNRREFLACLNHRDPRFHDVYRVNAISGESKPVLENPGFSAFLADFDLNVRIAQRPTGEGGQEWLLRDGDGSWRTLVTLGLDDASSTRWVSIDANGRTLYMVDSRGREASALVAMELETGEVRVLAEHAGCDVEDVFVQPGDGVPLHASFDDGMPMVQTLDDTSIPETRIAPGGPGRRAWTASSSLALEVAIIETESDLEPQSYALTRTAGEIGMERLQPRPALAAYAFRRMKPLRIKSRDGLVLPCYLTRPSAAGPAPLVLCVHGGPWGRDRWGFNSLHQWLANRGYAALSVNFRGSTGFGKAFVNAANREWGGRMQDDLVDAVRHVCADGSIDAKRIGIFGVSYGGYAALAGLAFEPEFFACGVSLVGPSNLVTLLRSIPPYWASALARYKARIGDPDTPEGEAMLLSRSPLASVERIRRPLLVAHGANDPRVKQSESDAIVAALRERGVPVTYLVYPDEGHGLARAENNLSFFAKCEEFLGRHLGGSVEPMGSDADGSSMRVECGG